MNYLKLLIRPIFNSKLFVSVRNIIGYKPVGFLFPNSVKNFSCSDLFFWRTDNGFKTIFRFSNIPEIFFGINKSKVLIIFYDSLGIELKRTKIKVKASVSEIEIDSAYLGGITDIGTFSIFHLIDRDDTQEIKIINRCYVAYQRDQSIPTFVHGNIEAQYINLASQEKEKVENDIAKVVYFKNEYLIQKNLSLFDYSELLFSNPHKARIWISIDGKREILESLSSKLIKIKDNDVVSVRSNLSMPRPVIFSYKGKFFDCHHG